VTTTCTNTIGSRYIYPFQACQTWSIWWSACQA